MLRVHQQDNRGGFQRLEWACLGHVPGRKLKRQTPDDSAVSVLLNGLRGNDNKLAADRNWLIARVEAEAGLRRAEVRSLANALNQPRGRLYTRTCDALFGDARCGLDTGRPAYRGEGTVARPISGRTFAAAGLSAYGAGWFTAGTLTWTGGGNAGAVQQVRGHGVRDLAILDLWEPSGLALAAGDAFTIVAGCDRTFEACRRKFGNVANFRGFPHLPGPDYPMTYARPGADNDGGRLV